MKTMLVAAVITIAILAFGSYLIVSNSYAAPLPNPYEAIGYENTKILQGINEIRKKHNIPRLTIDKRLNISSYAKSVDMAQGGYYDHADKQGRASWFLIDNVMPGCISKGENLGLSNIGIKDVVKGWENSKTHLDNILDKKYQKIGISSVYYGDYLGHHATTVVTTHFCQTE